MDRDKHKNIFILIAVIAVIVIDVAVIILVSCYNNTASPTASQAAFTMNYGTYSPNYAVVGAGIIDNNATPQSLLVEARRIKEAIKLPKIPNSLGDSRSIAIRDLPNNTGISGSFSENNKTLYQIVYYYFNPSEFAGMDVAKYVDPLYILAISNVEYGGLNDPDTLLAPALPSGVPVTKQALLTFGYSEYLKSYPNVLRDDRKSYRGPMQMFPTGICKPIKPDEIKGSEYTRLKAADQSLVAVKEEEQNLQYVEGSGVSTYVGGDYITNAQGTYGDRYNYSDCVNRLAGYLKYQWGVFSEKSDINKSVIDTKYAWMAMSAIGHNSSPGMFSCDDSTNLGSEYYWWPYSSFGDARLYCHYLGTSNVINYLKEMAVNNVKAHRAGANWSFRIGRDEGFSLATMFVSKGWIPKGMWIDTMWNHEEKVAYPIQVLYNYFVLDAIYHGA